MRNVVKIPTNPQANGTDACPTCGRLAKVFVWGRCEQCADAEYAVANAVSGPVCPHYAPTTTGASE